MSEKFYIFPYRTVISRNLLKQFIGLAKDPMIKVPATEFVTIIDETSSTGEIHPFQFTTNLFIIEELAKLKALGKQIRNEKNAAKKLKVAKSHASATSSSTSGPSNQRDDQAELELLLAQTDKKEIRIYDKHHKGYVRIAY